MESTADNIQLSMSTDSGIAYPNRHFGIYMPSSSLNEPSKLTGNFPFMAYPPNRACAAYSCANEVFS